jgi:hypothetical protein
MSSIETHHVLNGTTIEVPHNHLIRQLLHPAEASANNWPSCRVVIEDFNTPNDIRTVKLNFQVINEGEVPPGYGYIGTVVHVNPRYIAHFAFKTLFNNL